MTVGGYCISDSLNSANVPDYSDGEVYGYYIPDKGKETLAGRSVVIFNVLLVLSDE